MWDTLMDQVVTLEQETTTQDGSGATARSFATLTTGIPASIQSSQSSTVSDYAKRGIRVDHEIYSTYDFDSKISGGLTLKYRFKDANGIAYIIHGVNKDLNQILSDEPLYRIDVQRLLV